MFFLRVPHLFQKSVDCIGNVARWTEREEQDDKESCLVSSCLFCLCLVSWTIYASINFSLPGIGTDRENKVLEAMIRSKPELYIDEYQDWFHSVTGTRLSIATMCRSILRLGSTSKKASLTHNFSSVWSRTKFAVTPEYTQIISLKIPSLLVYASIYCSRNQT